MSWLSTTIVVLGVVSILTAIAGGGLKSLGCQMPILRIRASRLLLALFGAAVLVVVRVTNLHTSQGTAVTVQWDSNFVKDLSRFVHRLRGLGAQHGTSHGGWGGQLPSKRCDLR
jgi:hypothetical protein